MIKNFLILFLLGFSQIFAQFQIENWKAYTSMSEIISTSYDNHKNIWAATSGGVFKYSTENDELTEYRNINSLLSIRSTAIHYDPYSDQVFVGSAEGFIDVFNYNDWEHITDIYSSNLFSNKRINDIESEFNIAYIGGGFGLTLLNTDENIFISNAQKFGNFDQSTVNKIIVGKDSIWLATNYGLAVAAKDEYLNNPSIWKTYGVEEGLTNSNISDLVLLNDTLYISDGTALYTLVHGKLNKIQDGIFFGIEKYNDDVLYAGYSALRGIKSNDLFDFSGYLIDGFKITGDNKILIHTGNNGLLCVFDNDTTKIEVNAPISNRIEDIDIQSSGNIWIATGNDRRGKGISMFDGIKWTQFTRQREDMPANAYHRIVVNQNDRIFASGWGPGFIEIQEKDTGYAVLSYDTSNTKMIGIGNDPGFLALGDIEEDKFGNIWTVSYGDLGDTGPLLAEYDTQNEKVNVFYNQYNFAMRNFFSLGIDQNNTKWIGGYKTVGSGLTYFNNNNTVDDLTDDIYGLVTRNSEPELLSNDIHAIETDLNGLVWIGTPVGLSVLLNPEAVIFDTQLIFRQINLVASSYVNDIFIDKLNNKWIATNEGVWVLNSDGSEVLTQITKNNSPLPDNEVLSVMVNPNDGRVYLGTTYGLFSAITLSAEPLNNYDISAYPQPYDPEKDESLIIDGLSENSIIKIVTPDGDYVNELRAAGRKAIWDGRNSNGNLVGSGVYLVIAQSVSNNKSGVAKIAVVRK